MEDPGRSLVFRISGPTVSPRRYVDVRLSFSKLAVDVRDLILGANRDIRVPAFFAAQEELERHALIMVSDHSDQVDALAILLHRHDNVTRKDIESVMRFGCRYLGSWLGEGRPRVRRTPA